MLMKQDSWGAKIPHHRPNMGKPGFRRRRRGSAKSTKPCVLRMRLRLLDRTNRTIRER